MGFYTTIDLILVSSIVLQVRYWLVLPLSFVSSYIWTHRAYWLVFDWIVICVFRKQTVSLYDHKHRQIFCHRLPIWLKLLWQFGRRAFVFFATFFRCPHSLSWQTSMVPFFPFTFNMSFPQSGQCVPVMLSCLKVWFVCLISDTACFAYDFISLMNWEAFNWPFAILESFCSHSAVNAGDFKSSGTKESSRFPFDVMKMSLPFFQLRSC